MIIAIGDIHGEFSKMQRGMVEVMESTVEPVNFVQVGDFGLGFERPKRDHDRLITINHLLQERDSHLYIIRGNHDNPAFWAWGTGYLFSNIHFVPDDSLMQIGGKWCYFAGGAVSVDRCKRRQGIDYWAAEIYEPKPFDQFDTKIPNVDILFTHDVYHPVSPFNVSSPNLKHWCELDDKLMGDILSSQYALMSLYHDICNKNPKFSWYHGHYHESHVTNNDGQVVHSLSILEFKEVR